MKHKRSAMSRIHCLPPVTTEKTKTEGEEAKPRSSGQCHAQESPVQWKVLDSGASWQSPTIQGSSPLFPSFSLWSREHRFLHVPQHCLSPGAKTDFINPPLSVCQSVIHDAAIAHSQTPTCITSKNKVPRTLPHSDPERQSVCWGLAKH